MTATKSSRRRRIPVNARRPIETPEKTVVPVARPSKTADASTYEGRFALHLQALRQAKYPTQGEFVKALDACGLEVSQKAVSTWETGERCPRLEWFPMIADALDVTPGELLPPE